MAPKSGSHPNTLNWCIINTLWHIHSVEYYSAVKRTNYRPGNGINDKCLIPSERSQSPKMSYSVVHFRFFWKLGVAAHTHEPSTQGGRGRKIAVSYKLEASLVYRAKPRGPQLHRETTSLEKTNKRRLAIR